MKRIVLIAGFESFNADLYRKAAFLAVSRCPELDIRVFSDRNITTNPDEVQAALKGADVFFGSLIFDYDQVLWLREHIANIPIRLIFESALELMSLTKIGAFSIGDKPKGMPKPVKFILDKFSNGKEEDKLAGYISFLKIGPKLLKFVPVQKVQDLRNWLIIYGYWNAGGTENVAALFWTLAGKYLDLQVGDIPAPIETPNMGLLHPDYPGYFTSPKAYLEWYEKRSQESGVRSQEKEKNKITQSPVPSHQSPVIGILLYRKHVITKQNYIPQLIRKFEDSGLIPLPIFINGVEGHVAVRDWMTTDYETQQRQQGNIETPSLSSAAVKVDAIISTIGFPLVGGPAGSMEAGRQIEVAKRILTAKNIPYIVAAPLLIQDIHSWTRQGIGGLQSVVLYALPELDGAIDTIPLGGLVGEDIYLVPERVQRLIDRVKNWVSLRQKLASERKIAIILYGFPPGYGAVGTAALLNVPRSLIKLLHALKEQGYTVGKIPEDGEELIKQVKAIDEEMETWEKDKPFPTDANTVNARKLEKWLGYLRTSKIEKQWKSLTGAGIKTYGDELHLGGVKLGNVWISVQPPLGIQGDPMRLMFERDLTPHPQYAAFYKWLQNEFQADAIVHFGMHGTVEWLPGSPLGNTGYSWSDILLGNLPNLYIYAANNPSESILAKRRGYGVLISHNVPPYGRAGLYKELVSLRDLIAEYREDPKKNYVLKEGICKKIVDTGLDVDCPFDDAKKLGIAFTPENVRMFSGHAFDDYLIKLYEYLQVLENRLFSSGLHTLGEAPSEEELKGYLDAFFGEENKPQRREERREEEEKIITSLLNQSTDELTNLLRGLNGEFIPPAPGGDLLRDGAGVLPTGRNIHALDPYRMPSPAAYERGREIARKIIDQHLAEHQKYPETVAVLLWGLDAIKTKGESLGILLELVGAEPVKEGTGRIVRYDLKPLSDVGHPRIDVLGNLSGIFRDSFVNIIELLDDLFRRAAEVDEPEEQNFIRKHALELKAQGVENSSARLFSNPSGDFGSLVNDRVVDGNWENGEELGKTWESRNVFSYGRKDKGQARPEVLQTLLKTSDRIVQEIDSVEYGLTDIQEYYANTGGLKKAAEQQSGKKVTASFVESFSKDTTPRNLDDLLRMEYRTKLLNPKWAEAMANQGSGGAFEISQRMTALIGWGGTADFRDHWVYEQAADTYALDAEMAEKLRKANPEAFRNIVSRMLEAHGRGLWNADGNRLEKLRQLYELSDEQLEGVTV
ncbi:magnesium chelatase subunit H [Sphaerospermopsis kisseleviana CS-549]|uniref:magnesium chelatase n=1 Tax=Sphaerospermopsis kisseleviana CS-549 TaxID=3021783 RepID=A0ABT5A0N2_9CYAN|nr:magnesium chelatase subunit H [Sphaerospermopsis kisseleviana]MDB9444472.1 magnesium chelatase subunit H [Sphaerospermopsis kisseleviana CS-549]BAZ82959.1 protoporphyrin IX magnesium chelatase [Sphaerospermopsis kisseleviana NIES-73]